jgi:hypothetical protein
MQAMSRVLTEIKSAFQDDIVAVSPAVVSALKAVEAALVSITGVAQTAAIAISQVFSLGAKLGDVMSGVGSVVNKCRHAADEPCRQDFGHERRARQTFCGIGRGRRFLQRNERKNDFRANRSRAQKFRPARSGAAQA